MLYEVITDEEDAEGEHVLLLRLAAVDQRLELGAYVVAVEDGLDRVGVRLAPCDGRGPELLLPEEKALSCLDEPDARPQEGVP